MKMDYQKIYQQISKKAHTEIYHFMKMNQISADDYIFQTYFDFIVKKYKIKILEHYTLDSLILGITMIDDYGISISYDENSIPTRQNFTKCHEIGHLVLEHEGTTFTEINNSNKKDEIEADLFSSFVLIPDIVLFHKIVNQNKNFSTICQELQISQEAFKYRLINFLQYQTKLPRNIAEKYTKDYRFKNNSSNLIAIFNDYKSTIINSYQSVKIDSYLQTINLIQKNGFITQLDCTQLNNKDMQEKLLKQNNIKIWSYYNKGKTLWYAWNTDKLTNIEAKQKAKLIHTLKLL